MRNITSSKDAQPKQAKNGSSKGKAKLKGKGKEVEGNEPDHPDATEAPSTKTAAGGLSRQQSINSSSSDIPVTRSLRRRQISNSSAVALQHSQASATTIKRRRAK
ncbi:hypothetical protein F53441_1077 [Fusarium austroafricanum]|uniref:Uncharacterized protein n=1 Tax=Fusarium austroafricanum TaxID=2364996 RepID=A0A8H4KVD8_9HYPO|nr:hypothetical protein F53441_1077 [Fusarium austroafricanum]